MYTISSITDVVTRLGWSVIPVGIDKKPLFSWKKYQSEHASIEQINQWQKQYNPPAWAVITGSISKLIILDGDGEAGRETFERLGISPHRQTGSGGLHSDFGHPGWFVPTLNSKSKIELGERWPGLDIRGDGGYAVFCGKNTSGEYVWLRTPGELDSLDSLPKELRSFLGLLYPPEERAKRSIADVVLEKYLKEASFRGRDNACFDLACQLRDNNYSRSEAESYCLEFARRTHTTNQKGKHEAFTEADAWTKVNSAYSASARTPWTSYIPNHQEHASNGNGHKPPDHNETTAKPPQPFNFTDLGNAERFSTKYRDTVRWCETWNTWLIFNGKCWEPDRTGHVDRLAKIVVRNIYKEAAAEPDDDLRKRIAKHANASESNRAVRAMLDRAKSELPAVPDDFNKHLYLLNCKNGALDLRTGELRNHSPYDMLTRCLKINYNPLATCPKWDDFIQGIFDNDSDLIQFMKEALGMSLCGDTSEQCLFICHGSGSNGKTTMLETVRIIMEDYGLAANIETFQVRKNQGIGNDVAELYGARFVTASENTMGSRLNEAFIKKATGQEPLRARRLHANEFQFMPEFTIWFPVNHKPVVKDTSKGMWRRVHFIPFNVTIEGDKLDKHLGEKLLDESEGILASLVQGHIDWHKRGHLEPPKAVKDATQAYRAEMDTVSNFIEEECLIGDGKTVSTKILLERFESWCEQNGEKYDPKTLKTALRERGLHSTKSTGGRYYWQGIGLKDSGPKNGLFAWNELEENDESGPSGPSGPKSNIFHATENTSQKTWNLGPLTSTTSTFELENENEKSTRSTQESDFELEKKWTQSGPSGPTPPNRTCLKCGARDWQWDDLLDRYTCGKCNHG